ncbi:hypothetical protein F5984_09115 [Rudanella paleaurantiibacter]|uniref:Uncharacterized protein n=1 Tax=Rudanella paleaurantiibacter TaxID=2614655 RepID=A0A7J5TZV7_9BACT|nr:hypothetical protein [Rudanella paleaurantiibacter]KAB7730980.1 hypothetical protein F5984_09115 [Rudanella paleaurantiibacter]
MSARELKAELHQRIEDLTDEQLLQVYAFVNEQYGGGEGDFDPNTPEVLAKIEKSLASVGEQKTYTTDDILTLIKQCNTR